MTNAGELELDARPPRDPLGAFCKANHAELAGSEGGILAGLTFAAKDVFDVAGTRTGFGSPDWLRTHEAAADTATVVSELLEAGASLVARTISDELTYSLTGENVHFGTPTNPRAPDRVPGGSSSGSASAVAGGLVDFALGTDCGGSVRLPASYCGLLGVRPTHGRVAMTGVVPLAPSFDVVGWFAHDVSIFSRVGSVLFGNDGSRVPLERVRIVRDAFDQLEPSVREALTPAIKVIAEAVPTVDEVTISSDGLDGWRKTFQTIQAAEIWTNHGDWVRETRPSFGPGIRERFDWASQVSGTEVESARGHRAAIQARLDAVLSPGSALLLPTSPRAAPPRSTPADKIEIAFRNQAMTLLCIAGLAGLPQLSLPLALLDGLPLGLSLIGWRGADEILLDLARAVMPDQTA